jgi:hypothetical protein
LKSLHVARPASEPTLLSVMRIVPQVNELNIPKISNVKYKIGFVLATAAQA